MQQKPPPAAEKIAVVKDALAARRVIEATYNGNRIKLWPHEIFVRNQAIYIRAHNPQKALRHDEAPRLGEFNAAGLSDISMAEACFAPLARSDAAAAREGDQSIATVEDD